MAPVNVNVLIVVQLDASEDFWRLTVPLMYLLL